MLSYAVYVVRRYGVERNRNCSMKYCGYISAVDAVLEGVGGWGERERRKVDSCRFVDGPTAMFHLLTMATEHATAGWR